ncbi:hypothetical protein [Bacillus wiedmannii]|uniref:hypothetical protein n=1 Tax=Bacillus wiedmannii TaxID=1890302 RepID=UPI0015CF4AA8|nr:hypothetical protein [Bacillus wiedmannii]
MKDFEKEAMQARLDLAERQINKLIDRIRSVDGKTIDIELHLILSTVTGEPNKWIEF